MNYYALINPDEELITDLHELLDNKMFEQLRDKLSDIIKPIHIGKYISGFKFLFDHNDWNYFGKSINEMKQFLMKCSIIDDYDNSRYSFETFWDFVTSNNNQKSQLDTEYAEHYFLLEGYDFADESNFY